MPLCRTLVSVGFCAVLFHSAAARMATDDAAPPIIHSNRMTPMLAAIPPAPPADKAMMQDMDRMNQDMAAAPMTGNPDHDFAAMMIPHHQGAIDMARAELTYGKDPTLRKLAQDIMSGQDQEIALMRNWLASHTSR